MLAELQKKPDNYFGLLKTVVHTCIQCSLPLSTCATVPVSCGRQYGLKPHAFGNHVTWRTGWATTSRYTQSRKLTARAAGSEGGRDHGGFRRHPVMFKVCRFGSWRVNGSRVGSAKIRMPADRAKAISTQRIYVRIRSSRDMPSILAAIVGEATVMVYVAKSGEVGE